MRAGRLRHKVDFLAKNAGSWVIAASVYAAIEPPKEAQASGLDGLSAGYVDTVIIRTDSRIVPGQLLQFDSRYWRVLTVQNQRERVGMAVLGCRPYIGMAATYTPVGGSGTEVTAILLENIDQISLPAGFQRHTEPYDAVELIQVQFSTKPAVGDAIVINAKNCTIDAPPVIDDGYIWRYPVK